MMIDKTMTTHPTSEYSWSVEAEKAFNTWFHESYGEYSFRSEWFFGDTEVEDVKTRQDLMYKWIHSAFVEAYQVAKTENNHE